MLRATSEPVTGPQGTKQPGSPSINAVIPGQVWAIGAMLFLGGTLRLYNLGAKGLWGDEIWTAQWSRGRLEDVWRTLTRIPDMPLIYVLANISSRFGESEFWIRLSAALFGIIGILVFYFLAKLTLGRRTALVGVVLLTISPIDIWYSQDARYYTQLSTLGMASVYFLFSYLTSSGARLSTLLGFLLVTSAALYTHVFAGWIILAELIFATYFLLQQDKSRDHTTPQIRRQIRTKAIWLGAASLLLTLFALPIVASLVATLQSGVSSTGEGMAQFRIVPALPQFLTLAFLADVLRYFSGGHIATIVMVPLFFAGFIGIWRSKRTVAVLMVCLVAVPIVTLLFLELSHGISFKYFFFLLPFYLLCVAEGLVSMAASTGRFLGTRRSPKHPSQLTPSSDHLSGEQALLGILLLVMLLISVRSLSLVYRQAKINDWRSIADYLTTNVRSGDVVLVERWGQSALTYYLPDEVDFPVLELTPERWEHLRAVDKRIWLIGLDGEYESQVKNTYQKIAESEWQDPRWLYKRSQDDSFFFPVTEFAASIYVSGAAQQTSVIDFVDIDDAKWTDTTYRAVAPGQRTSVQLTLEALAQRELVIHYFDHPGKDFEVLIDGQLAGAVTGGSSAEWQTRRYRLPDTADATVDVALMAVGREAIGLDWVELHYVSMIDEGATELPLTG
jgi:hypothetical protein